jgi:hypothetical protein
VGTEMTKAIDRWENEGGLTEDPPAIVGACKLTMPGISVPERGPFIGSTSGHEDCSNFD